MLTVRAYSLAAAAFLLVACGDDDDDMKFDGPPGLATGPCVQSLCYSDLICIQGGCYPNPASGGNGSSNPTSPDPTDSGGTEGASETGTSGNVSTDPTATSDPPGTTTGVEPMTTTATTITTTSTTTSTTDPSESDTRPDTNDSQSFVQPDTDGGDCGGVACGPDEICSLLDDMPTCLPSCDPLNKASCAQGEVCVPDEEAGFVCAPDVSEGTGKVSDGCVYANGCDPGNICLTGTYVANCNGPYCCSAFCDLDLADPCVQYGMVCVSWHEQGMAPAGEEDIGLCILE